MTKKVIPFKPPIIREGPFDPSEQTKFVSITYPESLVKGTIRLDWMLYTIHAFSPVNGGGILFQGARSTDRVNEGVNHLVPSVGTLTSDLKREAVEDLYSALKLAATQPLDAQTAYAVRRALDKADGLEIEG